MIAKVADDFKVNAMHGILSHEMKRHIIDGSKVIINKTDADKKVDEFEFEPNEVYAMDIIMTSGEGKPQEIDDRDTTVFKRTYEVSELCLLSFLLGSIAPKIIVNLFTPTGLHDNQRMQDYFSLPHRGTNRFHGATINPWDLGLAGTFSFKLCQQFLDTSKPCIYPPGSNIDHLIINRMPINLK